MENAHWKQLKTVYKAIKPELEKLLVILSDISVQSKRVAA